MMREVEGNKVINRELSNKMVTERGLLCAYVMFDASSIGSKAVCMSEK